MQFSPSTIAFPNYEVSTSNGIGISSGISSYVPKVSLDTFNLGVFEDWICWENQSNRAPSLSPTKSINTIVTTPPAIYFKSEASKSPNLSSPDLENANKCITEDGYKKKIMCFEEQGIHRQNSLQKSHQRLSKSESLLNDRKEEFLFLFNCSPEPSLNPIDEERPDIKNSENEVNNFPKIVDKKTSGFNSLSDLPYASQRQHSNRSKLTTNDSESYEKEKSMIESTQNEYHNADCFDTKSSENEEIRPFSSSPYLFQSYTGPHSQKPKSVRSSSRKRKSRDFEDTELGGSKSENAAKNLCPNRNCDSVEETQINGTVHSVGRTKTPKKTAHNMIEKRYRTNLNDKIAALRDAVPSLRVAAKNDLNFVQETNVDDYKMKKTEQKYDDGCGYKQKNGNLEAEAEDVLSLPMVHKLNKATILTKAAEYIAHLEKLNRKLLSENSALETRLNTIEMLKLSPKSEGI